MRRLVAQLLLKLLIPLLLGLILVGVFHRTEAWLASGLFVFWRMLGLGGEWKRSGQAPPDWEQRKRDLMEFYQQRDAAPLDGSEGELLAAGARVSLSKAVQLTTAQVESERMAWVPPRPRGDLFAEALGLLGYVLILPLVASLNRLEFFSFRRSCKLIDMVVIGIALLLYAAPHLRRLRAASLMEPWRWWGCPAIVLAAILAGQLSGPHAYLNPFHSDHRRLAAEKVLQLTDTIVAADHADWLTDYAVELARKGAQSEAIALCEHALRLRPGMTQALRLLEELRGPPPDSPLPIAPNAPYFATGESPLKAGRTLLTKDLETIQACTVVLLPMGDIADDVLDYAAAVITREIGMPALVYERTLSLPEHTRRRGLAVGRQWSVESLRNAVQRELSGPLPQAPLKFLVITSADMYAGDANFIFNVSANWGGIVATAQFDRAASSHDLLCHRIAKQSLSAIIKSFGIQPSTDRRCVTSYPASIDELDAKGNRPLPATREAFDAKLREMNAPWLRYRAARR